MCEEGKRGEGVLVRGKREKGVLADKKEVPPS